MTRASLAWVVGVGLLGFVFGSCGRDTIRDERDTAQEASRVLRQQLDSTKAAQAKTDTITKVVIRADARLAAQNDSLISVLVYADSVLRDSAATLASTRIALAVTISRATEFQSAAMLYRDSVRTLIAAHALERFAVNKTLIAADSAVNGWKDVATAERRNGHKKFWRGVVWGGATGVVVTLLAVVL